MEKIICSLKAFIFLIVIPGLCVAINETRSEEILPNVIRKVPPTSDNETRNCEMNEIYIVDGERTLILTNGKMARNIEHIREEEKNLANQVRNQDKIISYQKQRIKQLEAKVNEYLLLIQKQESSFQSTNEKINMTETRLVSALSEKTRLETELESKTIETRNDKLRISDLEEMIRLKDSENDELRRQVHGEHDQVVKSLKQKQLQCEEKLSLRNSTIDSLKREVQHMQEKVISCRKTCANSSEIAVNCQSLEDQLSEQDKTILLLKDQITSQASAMTSLNAILHKEQIVIENLNHQISVQAETETIIQDELTQQMELINAQAETISLLKQIDRDEDYMRSAKEIALKILQNTVYTMVNNIQTCSQEVAVGLRSRIDTLEKQQKPLELLVEKMRTAMSNMEKMEGKKQNRASGSKRICETSLRMMQLMEKQTSKILEIRNFCDKGCDFDPRVIEKMEESYRPVNHQTCKRFFNSQNHGVNQSERVCRGSPNLEQEFGLFKVSSGDEIVVGGEVVYTCQDGSYINSETKLNQFRIKCGPDGNFEFPQIWPRCS